MPFHALIPSPLGPILLESDETSLLGLYFTGQRDLPRVPGVQAAAKVVSDPTAGLQGGRAIRSFRAVRGQAADRSGTLFPNAAEAAVPSWDAPRAETAALHPLSEDTPAGALAVLEQARRELDEYWRGERKVFEVPLAPRGTAFQQTVWGALLTVPCGETLSYGELAARAGLGAGHGRAVGSAVGSNPISIIIPCHRILARNGTLNGYGGGLDRKVRLLAIEGFTIH